jgi:DNA-binding CsgD family transcriptional regulator/tetratricopeptide (TPR) repeat protein
VAEAAAPPTLRLTILRRLSFLPEDTVRVLQAASILGSAFSLTDLALISGRPAIGLGAALTEAIRSRVIEDDGLQLRFRHDLIRDSLYEDIPVSVRRGLHHEAAQRLARAGAPPLRVAEHFARGATMADGEAVEWLPRAAREAAAVSPATAASLLDRAITLMRPDDPGRDQLVAERAATLMLAGGIADAVDACRQLLERPHDPAIEGAIRICLGHALMAQGRTREGLAEMERAAQSSLLTDAEHAAAQSRASFARLSLGDLEGAASAARQAAPAAEAAGDQYSASIAVNTLAMLSDARGQFADALRISDDALRLANESLARQGRQYPVQLARGYILTHLDRLGDARSTLQAGRHLCEERGVHWPLPSFAVFLGFERFIAGQWQDALAELESGLGLAEETGETYSMILARVLTALISFHRDDLSQAAAAMAIADRDLTGRDFLYHSHWAAWPQALLQEASGQSARALATMAAPWADGSTLGISVEGVIVGADLVRLARAQGDTGLARQVAAAVGEVASRNDLAWLRGAALRCRGLAENDVQALAAAVDAYAGSARPLELALVSEEAATAFIEHGDRARASSLLEQAIAIYERLDATRDLARAAAVRRRAGVQRGVRGPRNRPQSGWPSLTPTERTVAGLVAEGLSNPQIGERLFISRRTVQTHLAHVFAKLDISSRVQLAAQVTRRQEAG